MKKLLLFGICAAFTGAISAQKLASKDVENKNVILEEFTGKTCGFCPDGHKKGDEFSAANPGRVVLINIHCGSYARGIPNYNVMLGSANYGDDLYKHPDVKLRGFPAGTVNRTLLPRIVVKTLLLLELHKSRGSIGLQQALLFLQRLHL